VKRDLIFHSRQIVSFDTSVYQGFYRVCSGGHFLIRIVMATTNFGCLLILLLMSRRMFVLATLMTLIQQVSGTPYVTGGDSPAGTDCSGLASWVSNMATDRPVFGNRFNTGNEESALLARGFQYGTAPGALVIGWNGGHTAVTLPDGTAVSSGEGGGVRIGGAGAYQPQFSHHMFLPMEPEVLDEAPPPPPGPVLVDAVAPELPPPGPDPVDAVAPEPPAPAPVPVDAVNELPPPPPEPAPAGDYPGAAV
jgi:hypothetical protein